MTTHTTAPATGNAGTPSTDKKASGTAAPTAEAEAKALPKNARTLVEAARRNGWDVTVTTRIVGGTYVRAVEVGGAVPVRSGVQEVTARCVWDGSRYGAAGSERDGRYGAGYRDVLTLVRETRAIDRAAEADGRTVWGRDAAEWRRQLSAAVTKVAEAAAEARFEVEQMTGAAGVRARAALADAQKAYRDAVDADTRAGRAHKATGGRDARPLAAEREAVVDAGKRVRDALERVKDAPRAAEAEALALVAIAEAEREMQREEEAWRARLAAEDRQPTAAGYAVLVRMFQDPTRAWVAWHAENGRADEPFHEAYDRWTETRYGKGHRSAYTRAYLNATAALDTARGALAVAVGTAQGGAEGRVLAARGQDRSRAARQWVASWLERGWKRDSRAGEFAKNHPVEAEAVRTARLTVDGVEAYRRAERQAWEAAQAETTAP